MELPGREFALVVGQTARFRFFTSSTRTEDTLGAVVPSPDRHLTEIDPVEATVEAREGGGRVPVRLKSALTEVGTLALSFVERDRDEGFGLEFNVREKPRSSKSAGRARKDAR
jgi:hypothetical protein